MPMPRKHKDDAARQKAYRKRQRQARDKLVAEISLPPPPAIPSMPSAKRWRVLHERARAALETLLDEMTEYRENRTEEWQETDRGTEFQELLDGVEAAFAAVEDVEMM